MWLLHIHIRTYERIHVLPIKLTFGTHAFVVDVCGRTRAPPRGKGEIGVREAHPITQCSLPQVPFRSRAENWFQGLCVQLRSSDWMGAFPVFYQCMVQSILS